jgi:hypothetical protein
MTLYTRLHVIQPVIQDPMFVITEGKFLFEIFLELGEKQCCGAGSGAGSGAGAASFGRSRSRNAIGLRLRYSSSDNGIKHGWELKNDAKCNSL